MVFLTWVRIVDSDSNIVHGGLLSKYVTPCGRLIVILVMLEANCGKKSFEYEVIFFLLKSIITLFRNDKVNYNAHWVCTC